MEDVFSGAGARGSVLTAGGTGAVVAGASGFVSGCFSGALAGGGVTAAVVRGATARFSTRSRARRRSSASSAGGVGMEICGSRRIIGRRWSSILPQNRSR